MAKPQTATPEIIDLIDRRRDQRICDKTPDKGPRATLKHSLDHRPAGNDTQAYA
jgi:hypothetical protein